MDNTTLPTLSPTDVSFVLVDVSPEIEHYASIQDFTGPAPVPPQTLGAWFCPRCSRAFHSADRARHQCQPNPAHWHVIDSEGRVRHAPDYAGAFTYGVDAGCSRCEPLAHEPRYHFEARPSREYDGLTTIWAVSNSGVEPEVSLVDLEPANVATYLHDHMPDAVVERMRA